MKNNKGITLITLSIYIILALIVLGVLAAIITNFRGNMEYVNEGTIQDTEFDKLNVQMLKEMKTEGNFVNEGATTNTILAFSNGNTYTYENNSIYLNDNIQVAKNISSFTTTVEEVNNKQKLSIEVTINEKTRKSEYVSSTEIPEWIKVEYIESTGIQWIDTGIIPDSSTDFELSISLSDIASTAAIMGARTSSTDSPYFNLFITSNKLRWDYDTTRKTVNLICTAGSVINITKNGTTTSFTTNETTVNLTDSTTEFNLPYTMYLCNLNQDKPETRFAKMKIYYMKIYQNGQMVRDFIPVLDNNNVACLYDKVTKQYFYNQGTGEFLYKNEVYAKVEHIESTGTQWIDTQIIPDSKTNFELSMSLSETATRAAIMGARKADGGPPYFNMFILSNQLRWDYYDSTVNPDLTCTAGSTINITKNGTTTSFTTNGKTVNLINSTTEFTAPHTMYLCNLNQDTPETRFAKMKIYYMKIYQNGQMVRDFIPVLDNNNVACLYDRVENKFFYNKGTGTFRYT